MSDDATKSLKRLLDPMERLSEVLFGLIMVLTFTCSFSVVGAGRSEVRKMLIAALGCNLAWGIIDAVFYLMSCLNEQERGLVMLRALRKTNDPLESRRIIASAVPPLLASVLQEAQFEAMRERLKQLPGPPAHARLAKDDYLAAVGVLLLVFLSTFPVAIPFIFIQQPRLALRISNAVAIAMLFAAGYAYGYRSGFRPSTVGLAIVVIGLAMVAITIVLGG